jgi:hypothetical protein
MPFRIETLAMTDRKKPGWAFWATVIFMLALPAAYGGAYAKMVKLQPFKYWHGGPTEGVAPHYSDDKHENRWKQFFWLANWIDRRVRPKLWSAY